MNGLLAGVVVSGNICPPVKECWPELAAICGARFYGERILIGADERLRAPAPAKPDLTVGEGEAPLPPAKDPLAGVVVSGKDNLYWSWGFPPVNGLLTGVGLPVLDFPPVKECWPELADLWRALLR